MAEHSFASKRADDERSKRPQYKAIIEHDGLPRKQLSNQVLNM
jgi:U11/U12 small nuclear ribonucleoprotein SNRNP48